MRLQLHNDTKSRLPGKQIRELFELICEREAKPDWSASVNAVFISDRTMQRLNKKHRKLDRPTDVLSFNIDRPQNVDAVFGEVYISCDTARRQAAELGSSIIDEYLRLVCHGLLHLFGYDHKKAADAAGMRQLEEEYLAQLREG